MTDQDCPHEHIIEGMDQDVCGDCGYTWDNYDDADEVASNDVCPICHGTGVEWDGPEPCEHCDGEGYEWWW